jgi:hypothetical protein
MHRGLRRARRLAFAPLLVACSACLDRPVAPLEPRTNNVLIEQVSQRSVDKIDLLFMIDNSASMADKQKVLAAAIPDLVNRLVSPPCGSVGADGRFVAADAQPTDGAAKCPAGQAREFNRIVDIHIGVVSSSLGGHGSDSCSTQGSVTGRNPTADDHAHLLTRSPRPAGGDLSMPTPAVKTWNDAGFLAWDPTGTKNSPPGEADVAALQQQVKDIVLGADQAGCGFEAQLEGWYRFLVEPNPPLTVDHANGLDFRGAVTSTGTDEALLAQRADFLRPDSLVAIISLTDENDGSVIDGALPAGVCRHPVIDPVTGRATGCQADDGTGKLTRCPDGDAACGREPWPDAYRTRLSFENGAPFPANWLAAQFLTVPTNAPYGLFKGQNYFHLLPGTTACDQDWGSPDCRSCYLDTAAASDPKCKAALAGTANVGEDDDPVSLRLWDMRRRFGVDMLYPLQRYVEGIKSAQVFDRNGYLVQNPLYDDLPYRKQVAAGKALRPKAAQRPSSNVFFASIAGVPWQDLARDPSDLSKGYKPAVSKPGDPGLDAPVAGVTKADGSPATAWDVILGDPFNPDVRDPVTGKTGIAPLDPLMVESNKPRFGFGSPAKKHPITGETLGDAWNSVNGSDWVTKPSTLPGTAQDLEYACIFPLPSNEDPRDCDAIKKAGGACECADDAEDSKNPLCAVTPDPSQRAKGTFGTFDPQHRQYRAKAYPGTRYLEVLRGIGEQAVVASICATNLDEKRKDAADYGYRPAVAAIVDRLKDALGEKCLPRKLDPDPETGTTPCLILDARMPVPAPGVADLFSPAEIAACNRCDGPAREPLDTPAHPVSRETLVGDARQYRCVCAVTQYGQGKGTTAAERDACRTAPDPLSLEHGGWCYVDPARASDAKVRAAEQQLVARCPSTEQQKIRFVDADVEQANLFITCLGATAGK